ncbi:MAG: metal-dependent hydrolase [Calditrichaeota bacterium]|nr:metal-dependent hydrolase [Calditrichota bacterium]
MDTVTQIALGAAVGELALGRKIGNRAMVYGAIGGIIPDLDILITPFFSETAALGIHRGYSHSLLFAFVLAPIAAYLLRKYHPAREVRWHQWFNLAFWSVFTHPILDAFTTYGTQLFLPFSNYPVAFSSVFVIDPLYTLPLIIGLILSWRLARENPTRRTINMVTLGISSAYLLLGLGLKQVVESRMEDGLRAAGITPQRLYSNPGPFNTLLWFGMAEAGDTLWVTHYSLLDDDEVIRFRPIPKNAHLIAASLDEAAIRRLLWFSRGFYTITTRDGQLYFNDLRFGRADFWMGSQADYVFRFRLVPGENPGEVRGFERQSPSFQATQGTAKRLFNRILGRKEISGEMPEGDVIDVQ